MTSGAFNDIAHNLHGCSPMWKQAIGIVSKHSPGLRGFKQGCKGNYYSLFCVCIGKLFLGLRTFCITCIITYVILTELL